jgi:hypothetical protein
MNIIVSNSNSLKEIYFTVVINMTGVNSGAGTAHPVRAHEFNSGF